ncbi:aldo/keto reductase family protein [Lacticigenium naphthae]|uniref:aldo/keto reductase family protein n=1 Tax=Lacticigenium naphthae TaxID=515351 RepID=UPI0004160275|nr:aldo/keto reductase [Lacticigenium naphthae]
MKTALQFEVANGRMIPAMGITLPPFQQSEEKERASAIESALGSGYRLFETTTIHKNEKLLNKLLHHTDVKREDLFLMYKLWNTDYRYEDAQKSVEETLERLETDYIDAFLINWPVGQYKEAWKALEDLYDAGKIRIIGVSNFQEKHLKELMKDARIKPMVNQIEIHPEMPQYSLVRYLKQEGILPIARGPLGRGSQHLINDPDLRMIAEHYQKTTIQVIYKWLIQREISVLTQSENSKRIQESLHIDDFILTKKEMEAIPYVLKKRNRPY